MPTQGGVRRREVELGNVGSSFTPKGAELCFTCGIIFLDALFSTVVLKTNSTAPIVYIGHRLYKIKNVARYFAKWFLMQFLVDLYWSENRKISGKDENIVH
nr:unnamed protein product [Callosobruchus analis]